MTKPFDATLRHLLEHYPEDWLRVIGLPVRGHVHAIDAQLATVAPEADKVLLVEEEDISWILHLEFQSSYAADLASRIHVYNTLLRHRHHVPVRSVVLLLRPQADGACMSGEVVRGFADELPYLTFRYQCVRVWELSADAILQNGVGALPLAPLADDAALRSEEIVRTIQRRLEVEASSGDAASLLAATYVLMGLRFPIEQFTKYFQGLPAMRESSSYQAIVAEGIAEGLAKGLSQGRLEGQLEGQSQGARRVLIDLGTKRFGAPAPAVLAGLERIEQIEEIERLVERIAIATSWDNLLATP